MSSLGAVGSVGSEAPRPSEHRAMMLRCAATIALLALLPRHAGCTAGLAASPPMGFNNCNVRVALGLSNWTCCSGNQALFEATAAALKSKGLLSLGYSYINTDDGAHAVIGCRSVLVSDRVRVLCPCARTVHQAG